MADDEEELQGQKTGTKDSIHIVKLFSKKVPLHFTMMLVTSFWPSEMGRNIPNLAFFEWNVGHKVHILFYITKEMENSGYYATNKNYPEN